LHLLRQKGAIGGEDLREESHELLIHGMGIRNRDQWTGMVAKLLDRDPTKIKEPSKIMTIPPHTTRLLLPNPYRGCTKLDEIEE